MHQTATRLGYTSVDQVKELIEVHFARIAELDAFYLSMLPASRRTTITVEAAVKTKRFKPRTL